MVTAYELRHITNNYDLYILLDMLTSIAKIGKCTYSVDYLSYDQEKQLEQLGFTVRDNPDDNGMTISW